MHELRKFNVSGFAYCQETLTNARKNNVKLAEEIKSCTKWQVICVDPEHLHDKEWREITEWPHFRTNCVSASVDEAHLIYEWGEDFRIMFKHIGPFLRGRMPSWTSPVALTATVEPGAPTAHILNSLSMSGHMIQRSNERVNTQFIMQTLEHGLSGYEFPSLLPFINTGWKTVIHCQTIDIVFHCYIYICF